MQLKKFLPIAFVFLSFVVLGMYAGFLAIGAVDVAIEVSKSLVDADAALLGFLGIITVFIYNTYRDEVRFTEGKLDSLLAEHKRFVNSQTEIGGFRENQLSTSDSEYNEFQAKKGDLENRLKKLRQSSRDSFSWTITSAGFFVVSIFLSLLAMAELGSFVRLFAAASAPASMSMGLLCLFAMIWNLRVDLE